MAGSRAPGFEPIRPRFGASGLRQSKHLCHFSCRMSPFSAVLFNCGFLTAVRNDTGKRVIPNAPFVNPGTPFCHPERQRGISSNVPPLPALSPTADSSLPFGMTRENASSRNPRLGSRVIPKSSVPSPCHPEEFTTRDLQSRKEAEGGHKPEKIPPKRARMIAKL